MKTKKWWVAAALTVFCIVFLSVVGLAISPPEKQQIQFFGVSTLSGLKGVLLSVSLYVADDVKCNLSPEELQTQVELTLRRNGIKCITIRTSSREESIRIDQDDINAYALKHGLGLDFGTLDVKVRVLPILDETSIRKASVEVEFKQFVSLVRNPKIFTSATTWPYVSLSSFLPYHSSKIAQGIKEQVDKQLAEFCNDYLAANPKEPASKGR